MISGYPMTVETSVYIYIYFHLSIYLFIYQAIDIVSPVLTIMVYIMILPDNPSCHGDPFFWDPQPFFEDEWLPFTHFRLQEMCRWPFRKMGLAQNFGSNDPQK